MQLDPLYYEEDSVHYYVPQPEMLREMLYYPVSIGYFNCKPSYSVQRNMFSSYLLIVIMNGSLSFQTRYVKGIARAGQALLLDCNLPHSYAAQGKCAFTFVHFAGGQSQELYEAISQRGGGLVRLNNPNGLHETIGEMLSAMRSWHRLNEGQTSSAIYGMLMQLLECSGGAGDGVIGNPLVDRAIDYIRTHLAEKLSVENIAANAGYSASYFSHLFTEETGLSPYQFVVKSRIERAQQLLQTTRLSVQDIAFQCGFNSAANFCYTFRRFTGLSPHAYRQRPL